MTANRYDVSFWSDENWVELNNGDGCKTMNIKKKKPVNYRISKDEFYGVAKSWT